MVGLVSMGIFPDEMTSLSTGLDSKEMEKPWFLCWTKVEKLRLATRPSMPLLQGDVLCPREANKERKLSMRKIN